MKKIELKNDLNILAQLTRRAVIIYYKDKATVFFSLLGSLIILLLYVVFLGDIQSNSITNIFVNAQITPPEKAIKGFIDGWMLSGMLATACISVSLSANTIMARDKERGMENDLLTSPIKKWIITFSYFLYNFTITIISLTGLMIVAFLFLALGGGWYLSFSDVMGIIGTVVLSCLSSTLITVFICSFLKTEAQVGAVVGLVSSTLGFFIGAYMPMGMMAKPVQYISSSIPGSHSAGLLKNFFMNSPLEQLRIDGSLPPQVIDGIKGGYSIELNMFGKMIGPDIMAVVLAASVVVFVGLNLLLSYTKKVKFSSKK